MGGTCLNVGCIPSKALLHASELFEIAAKDFANLGIEATPKLNLPQMLKQKEESVTNLTKGVEFLMRKNKVDYLKGTGRIAGPGKVTVTGEDGAEQTLEARNIVIATGSEPSKIPGVEVDEKQIVDSTGALSPDQRAQAPAGHRRGHYRAGARLGVAPPGGRGDGDRVPRPHHPRRRRRGGDRLPALPDQAGGAVQDVVQGDRGQGGARPA